MPITMEIPDPPSPYKFDAIREPSRNWSEYVHEMYYSVIYGWISGNSGEAEELIGKKVPVAVREGSDWSEGVLPGTEVVTEDGVNIILTLVELCPFDSDAILRGIAPVRSGDHDSSYPFPKFSTPSNLGGYTGPGILVPIYPFLGGYSSKIPDEILKSILGINFRETCRVVQ